MATKATKESLLTAAIQLFREKGFNQVTVNDICNVIDVSKTAFYYYYKSKDELVCDYFSAGSLISNEDMISILSATDYGDQVLKIMELSVERIADAGAELAKELYRINLRREADQLTLNDSMAEIIKTLILRGQEAGQVKNPVSAEIIYKSLCYLSNGITLRWAMLDGKFDVLEESRTLFRALLLMD